MAVILTEDKKQAIDQVFWAGLQKTVDDLHGRERFAEARKALEAARAKFPKHLWIHTHLALSLYRDESLPLDQRCGEALDLLEQVDGAEPGGEDMDNCLIRGLAASFFKLGEYDRAGQWIARLQGRMSDHDTAAFSRYLIYIGYSQGVPLADPAKNDAHPAWKTLAPLIEPNDDAIFSKFTGKVGLALSGGGFGHLYTI